MAHGVDRYSIVVLLLLDCLLLFIKKTAVSRARRKIVQQTHRRA